MKFLREFFPSRGRSSVVDQVGTQTEQASALARIEGQKLLTDPRTNPATRPHADRLRDEQQRDALTLEHRRALRRGRVTDRRAAHAERALEEIQNAREALSPARAVTALQSGRRRFLSGALAASVALSIGSALGLAAVSVYTGGPAVAGYVAELCLTVMATTAILYRSHIDQATTDDTPSVWQGWRSRALLALVVVPLSASVLVNLAGWAFGAPVSPISALCAVGAGAAGGFAYLVADVSARAIRSAAGRVDSTDEDTLRVQAVGDGLFSFAEDQADGPAPVTSSAGDDVADSDGWVFDDDRVSLADDVEAFLRGRQDPPEGGVTSPLPHGPADGPQGGAKRLSEGGSHIDQGDHHIDSEQAFQGLPDRDDDEATERVIPAAEARRLSGLRTRYRVAEHMAAHPEDTVSQIAAALDVGESTVYRHKKAIEADDGGNQ